MANLFPGNLFPANVFPTKLFPRLVDKVKDYFAEDSRGWFLFLRDLDKRRRRARKIRIKAIAPTVGMAASTAVGTVAVHPLVRVEVSGLQAHTAVGFVGLPAGERIDWIEEEEELIEIFGALLATGEIEID